MCVWIVWSLKSTTGVGKVFGGAGRLGLSGYVGGCMGVGKLGKWEGLGLGDGRWVENKGGGVNMGGLLASPRSGQVGTGQFSISVECGGSEVVVLLCSSVCSSSTANTIQYSSVYVLGLALNDRLTSFLTRRHVLYILN